MNRNEKLAALRAASVPKGCSVIANRSGSAEAYLFKVGEKLVAKGFIGKAGKAAIFYAYKSPEARFASVSKWLADIEASHQANEERKAKAKAASARKLAVGDVLRCSWGYEQTNVDFYEVVALVGKSMVEIRAIASEAENDSGSNGFSGQCVPCPGQYIGEPMRKKAQGDHVRIESYANAYKLEPIAVVGDKPVYESSYWSAYA
ncbi:MAG: hypothetical protein R3E87_15120 [Burkholderiaceae bacterium]